MPLSIIPETRYGINVSNATYSIINTGSNITIFLYLPRYFNICMYSFISFLTWHYLRNIYSACFNIFPTSLVMRVDFELAKR